MLLDVFLQEDGVDLKDRDQGEIRKIKYLFFTSRIIPEIVEQIAQDRNESRETYDDELDGIEEFVFDIGEEISAGLDMMKNPE